ncbi:MAG: peroxiredoxin [Armatimonadota bacterium]|nr:peroxiredoxin [Armatimonadota bacterium]
MGVEVGQQAPDVTLVSADRKAVRLSEFRGRPTVLAFFPGAYTATCTREMCALRDGLEKFHAMAAQVVGISVDLPPSQKAWAEHLGLNFTLLSDFNREGIRAFGVEDPNFWGGLLPGVAMRSVFVLDRDGIVRYKWVAPTQGTEPNYDEVEAAVRSL